MLRNTLSSAGWQRFRSTLQAAGGPWPELLGQAQDLFSVDNDVVRKHLSSGDNYSGYLPVVGTRGPLSLDQQRQLTSSRYQQLGRSAFHDDLAQIKEGIGSMQRQCTRQTIKASIR